MELLLMLETLELMTSVLYQENVQVRITFSSALPLLQDTKRAALPKIYANALQY